MYWRGGGGGGAEKIFFSEKPKDLLWSIGSSYWTFNLGVNVGVMGKQIMAKKTVIFFLCPILVKHRLNKVEHRISPMGGPVGPLWNNFWPYVEIFGYRQSPLPYLCWTPVEQGWTLYLANEGTSCTPLDSSKMVLGGLRGPPKRQFLAIFGNIWP